MCCMYIYIYIYMLRKVRVSLGCPESHFGTICFSRGGD